MKVTKKKLSLKKITVAHLDNSSQGRARGGVNTDDCETLTQVTCPITDCGTMCEDTALCVTLVTNRDCSDPCTNEWSICVNC